MIWAAPQVAGLRLTQAGPEGLPALGELRHNNDASLGILPCPRLSGKLADISGH